MLRPNMPAVDDAEGTRRFAGGEVEPGVERFVAVTLSESKVPIVVGTVILGVIVIAAAVGLLFLAGLSSFGGGKGA